jgi:hypothetical protein
MSCNWAQRRGHDWRASVEPWFESSGCGAWLLTGQSASAADYASTWVMQQLDDAESASRQIDRWLAYFAEEDIESVASGYVNMRRRREGGSWVDVRALPPVRGLAGEAVHRGLVARELLASLPDPRDLVATRLVPVDGVERARRSRLRSGTWHEDAVELRCTDGLLFSARVDPMAARLLPWLDGQKTLAGAARALAASLEWPQDAFDASLPKLGRRLLELGIVAPSAEPAEPGD